MDRWMDRWMNRWMDKLLCVKVYGYVTFPSAAGSIREALNTIKLMRFRFVGEGCGGIVAVCTC